MTESQSILGLPADVPIGNHVIKITPPVLRWYLEALEIITTELQKEMTVKKGLFGKETATIADILNHFKKPSERLLAHIAKTTDKTPAWIMDNLTLVQAAAFTNEFLNVVDIEEVKKVFTGAVQRVKKQ